MKKNQILEVIVEPQDLLEEKMQSIRGGTAPADVKCSPTGEIRCRPKGKVGIKEQISAW